MLHSWHDRIPLVLFIGVSTTPELFESRFSRAMISLLDTKIVNTNTSRTTKDPLYAIYAKIQQNPETEVYLGPSIVNILSELAEDQGTTSRTIMRAIKYAYMTHMFANPLSVLYKPADLEEPLSPVLSQAIRNTRSFKAYCDYLARGDTSQRIKARQLLSSDETLEIQAREAVQIGQALLRSSLKAISTLHYIYHSTLNLDKFTVWETEAQLLQALPDLTDSDVFEAIEETMKTHRGGMSTTQLLDDPAEELADLRNHQASLSADPESEDASTFLRAYLQSRTSQTTSSLPVASRLQPNVNPFRQFLSEIYTIDLKSPLSHTVHPRPRSCIERALTRPADYLGCECCVWAPKSSAGVSDKTSLHPTSLLLSMLNEAGVLVNVQDLWDAFRDTLSRSRRDLADCDEVRVDDEEREDNDDDDDDRGTNERQMLALFYRALAELRYLGLIKQSKRKPGVECIQKTVWMGL